MTKPIDEVIDVLANSFLPCGEEMEVCPMCEVVSDAIYYLKEYKASQEKPLLNRLTAVLREVRGEIK